MKDKLFFFTNAELQRNEIPQPFDFATYTGNMKGKRDSIILISDKVKSYGYDPGEFESTKKITNSDKFLVRFDYNISNNHKLSLRHHYTKGNSIYPYNPASNATNITFYNNWINFLSITNSTSVELKSVMGKNMANSLILGYTTVRDDRDPNGGNFPMVMIKDGAGRIYLGSEEFSTANELNQNILTITNNLNIYKGQHTITIGTHNEFYHIYNLFIRQNFGRYEFNSVADFLSGAKAAYYTRSYSLVDNLTGDGSAAAADFNAFQLGLYGQDEFKLSDQLKISGGLRIDLPVFSDKPKSIDQFDTTLAKIEAAGYKTYGAKSGAMPKPQLLLSPRIGFNYDVNGDKKSQLRGGVGIFTSRIPFVWPAGSYTNNGLVVGGFSKTNVEFRPDWNNQYKAEDLGSTIKIPSGQIDLFAENFKFPQVLKASLGFDQKLPWGMVATVEGLYNKTINNILYYNVNIKPSVENLTGTPDNRLIFQGTTNSSFIEPVYSGIYIGTNTNKGYSYNITVQLQKEFNKGFMGSLAYTYGSSKSLNDGLSSQNSSQWRYVPNVNGRNNIDLSYSSFDLGSRIVGFISYRKEYINHLGTSINIVYIGQSGSRYSYVYLDGYKMTNQDRSDQDLIYIPKDATEIKLVDYTYKNKNGDNVTVTAAEQWEALQKFIESDKNLSANKGNYAPRNGSRTPFENNFDVKIAQDIIIKAGDQEHKLQITLDIFNLGNLLNKNWGKKYYIANGTYSLIKFEKFESGSKTPTFTYRKPTEANVSTVDDIFSISDAGIGGSRWYAQLGIRYIFGK